MEIALMVSEDYLCLPGEGRDPCFRLSEVPKQLQGFTKRLLVRAAEQWAPACAGVTKG